MYQVDGLDEYLASLEPCPECGRDDRTHRDEYGRYVACFEQVLGTLLRWGLYVD